MSSTFSFGFSGDDIDVDEVEKEEVVVSRQSNVKSVFHQGEGRAAYVPVPGLVTAEKHDINSWLSSLPSQISYHTLIINGKDKETSPTNTTTSTPVVLARREMFDIRAQLMAEDSIEHENAELIASIDEGDLKPNFYEGGFKTWECAMDLAKVVAADDNTPSGSTHIIELGAGSGMPSLAIFAKLLASPLPSEQSEQSQTRTHFTFADYNSAVLRLVTLPNILLTWNAVVSTTTSLQSGSGNDGIHGPQQQYQEEELDITPELIERFLNDLSQRGISISVVSGPWSPTFVDLVLSGIRDPESNPQAAMNTLILASETIYSPASLHAFSETLLDLLRRSMSASAAEANAHARSKAYVAAKKVYFGVGGGMDEFLAVLENIALGEVNIRNVLDVKSEGVGRIILEIEMAGQGHST